MLEQIRLSSSLVLLPTKVGCILTGKGTGITANNIMVNHVAIEHAEYDLRRFWDIETLGITPPEENPLTLVVSQIMQELHDSYCVVDGRRVVRLAMKNICGLSPNRSKAERRLRSL
jgi:hypothetical protein